MQTQSISRVGMANPTCSLVACHQNNMVVVYEVRANEGA